MIIRNKIQEFFNFQEFFKIFTPNILKLLGFIFIFIGQLAKIIISKGKYIIDPFGLGITVMAFGSITNFNPKPSCHQNGSMFRLMSIFILTKLMSQPILAWLNKYKNDEEKNKDRDKYMATNILKCMGFAFVMLGAWNQITNCGGNLLSDPFPIGVTAMFFSMLLYTVGIVDSWVPYQTMNFFIITKFMSHVTHAGHSELDIWGIKHEHNEHNKDDNFYNKLYKLYNLFEIKNKEQTAQSVVPVQPPVQSVVQVQPLVNEQFQSAGNVFRGYNNLI